jgi:hypothetical protein
VFKTVLEVLLGLTSCVRRATIANLVLWLFDSLLELTDLFARLLVIWRRHDHWESLASDKRLQWKTAEHSYGSAFRFIVVLPTAGIQTSQSSEISPLLALAVNGFGCYYLIKHDTMLVLATIHTNPIEYTAEEPYCCDMRITVAGTLVSSDVDSDPRGRTITTESCTSRLRTSIAGAAAVPRARAGVLSMALRAEITWTLLLLSRPLPRWRSVLSSPTESCT